MGSSGCLWWKRGKALSSSYSRDPVACMVLLSVGHAPSPKHEKRALVHQHRTHTPTSARSLVNSLLRQRYIAGRELANSSEQLRTASESGPRNRKQKRTRGVPKKCDLNRQFAFPELVEVRTCDRAVEQ